MKEMIKKVREDKEGFTLAELLVVVAIIAVLVAIAIPVFSASLNRANAATDEANIRAGYASAQTLAISDTKATGNYTLEKDGTVSQTAKNAYETKGSSANLDNGTADIAGQSPTWTEKKSITYTIGDDHKVTINNSDK